MEVHMHILFNYSVKKHENTSSKNQYPWYVSFTDDLFQTSSKNHLYIYELMTSN